MASLPAASGGGCPLGHDSSVPPPPPPPSKASLPAASGGGCPLGHDKRGAPPPPQDGPADGPDRPLVNPLAPSGGPSSHASCPVRRHNNLDARDGPVDPLDVVPESAIPAAGRGNSDSGREWLNPSPNQLYRALKRKNKAIDREDAESVAMVHNMVTDQSWAAVMEYEALHARRCAEPALTRFQGMDGIYSFKARFVNWMGWADLPFDRHDWYVNRCGREVKYVIDYYASPEEGGGVSYSIDARPAPTPTGLLDRTRLAFRRWRAGESWW